MAKNQHNAGLHYRPLNQLGLSNFNDYIENPIDSRFKFNPPPLKCGKLFELCQQSTGSKGKCRKRKASETLPVASASKNEGIHIRDQRRS